jgi:hypothetical protein
VTAGAGRGCALGLLLLSPVCAEYLTGYDTTTGDPVELAFGLLFFVPLYGAPALLIREAARRYGVRWPGVLALAAAFGIVQAGVVDQSLFSDSYRDIPYWQDMYLPTLIAPIGVSAYNALTFVGGHTIWSFSAPIALVEAAAAPETARRPWLRWPGLVLTALAYAAAAAVILSDHLRTETDHASPAQLAGALALAGLLAGFAFTRGRRPRPQARPGRVPPPLAVAAAALAVALGVQFAPSTWPGVALAVTLLAGAAAVVPMAARRPGWGRRHVAALAAGALLANAVIGFLAVPLGDVDPVAKLAHNAVLGAGALALAAWTLRRGQSETAPVPPAPPPR